MLTQIKNNMGTLTVSRQIIDQIIHHVHGAAAHIQYAIISVIFKLMHLLHAVLRK